MDVPRININMRGNRSLEAKERFPRAPSEKADWVNSDNKNSASFSANKYKSRSFLPYLPRKPFGEGEKLLTGNLIDFSKRFHFQHFSIYFAKIQHNSPIGHPPPHVFFGSGKYIYIFKKWKTNKNFNIFVDKSICFMQLCVL